MMRTPFAELVAASNFSFLRGASHPEELVLRAAELGLAGLAITDRNTLAGVVRGHLAARQAGLVFAPGVRLVFADGTPDIVAWPRDRAAYGRVCRLLTLGKRRARKGDCHLVLSDLLEWGDGFDLAVTSASTAKDGSGRRSGEPTKSQLAKDGPVARTLAALKAAFPEGVHLAVSLHRHGDDRYRLARSCRLADHYGLPLLATNDVLYHIPERRVLQDVVSCIRTHVTLETAGKLLQANAERYIKSADEIRRLFAGRSDALTTTVEILERLEFRLDDLAYEYPQDPVAGAADPQEVLVRLTWQGARWRYRDGVPAKVQKLLEHELELIGALAYAPYFLTVYDIVRFARSRGILCQGRGSAANSAVCFVLGITEVDPERSDLLFERFVSAERREPPDIDVDFEHERREEVIQYVYERYGRERAGLAATVITYRTRSALREVGRVFGLSEDTVSALAGNVWGRSRDGTGPRDIARLGFDANQHRLARVLELARELRGFPRHLSQHVGGFVITRSRLDEVVPIENAAMAGRTIIEWDKDDLNALGMLKIDILALGMLSCIRKALDLLRDHYGRKLTLAAIPAEDRAVYSMLSRADSIGVFQVESRAQMTMLPRLKPANFYDLVIEVAIVRPGPIQGDMVHPYLRRRQGREKVVYPSRELEKVLGKTLGVPLFQEQAMKIAIVAAGFSAAEADRLRRAMATFRRVGTIRSFRRKMVEGMVARGYDREFAQRCFRQIEGFGEYGFPESHAASFALLVYASAWMKCHYPDVFAAALLNAQPMGFYAPAQIVRDAAEHGVEIRPVDVNFSNWDACLEPADAAAKRLDPRHRTMAGEIRATHALRLGLRMVKGLARADAERLVAARAGGFDSIRHFWLKTGLSASVLEQLAEADCFRSLGLDRRAALWAVKALEKGVERLPLFEAARQAEPVCEPELALPPMPLGAHVVSDYRTLSLSLKAHPLSFLRDLLAVRGIIENIRLGEIAADRHVTVAGLVLVRQRPGSAKGVIFVTLEDETAIANLVIWPKLFERMRPVVLGARLIAASGRVQSESGVIHIIADALVDLTPLLARLSEDAGELSVLARSDEVRRPVIEQHRKFSCSSRLSRLIAEMPELAADLDRMAQGAARVMPRGRNFH